MNAKEVARGGLLAAAAVALLYVGGLTPWAGPAFCVVAGVSSAVPLIRRTRLHAAVLTYLATSVLGVLLVPRKGIVIGYVLICGLYPILKYCIESRTPRHAQSVIKIVYCNVTFGVMLLAVRAGLFPQTALSSFVQLFAVWLSVNVAFQVYDIGLSRLIAVLRRLLPPGK